MFKIFALLHNSLPITYLCRVYTILLNRLYNDTFNILSFIIFWNLIADTQYSPKVLFIDEKTVSAIHLCPYFLFFFHLRRSLVWNLTSLFLTLLFLEEMIEFFLTLIAGRILFFWRYLKFSLLSYEPSPNAELILISLLFF